MKKYSIFIALASLLTACTTSNVMLTGSQRPAVSVETVRVYMRPPSAEFETIAILSATSSASTSRDGSRMKAIEELRKKAADLGANGLLINGSGEGGSSTGVFVPTAGRGGVFVAGGGVTADVQAEAIFVK